MKLVLIACSIIILLAGCATVPGDSAPTPDAVTTILPSEQPSTSPIASPAPETTQPPLRVTYDDLRTLRATGIIDRLPFRMGDSFVYALMQLGYSEFDASQIFGQYRDFETNEFIIRNADLESVRGISRLTLTAGQIFGYEIGITSRNEVVTTTESGSEQLHTDDSKIEFEFSDGVLSAVTIEVMPRQLMFPNTIGINADEVRQSLLTRDIGEYSFAYDLTLSGADAPLSFDDGRAF